MGILTALPASTVAVNPRVLQFEGGRTRTAPTPKPRAPSAPSAPSRQIESAFESIVYQRQSQSISLSARFREIAARLEERLQDGGERAAQIAENQLGFEFLTNSRTEELTRFRERSTQLADGLRGEQRASFVSVSKSIEFRFEFSATLSASSLNGFSNAADSLVDSEALFENLLTYAQGLLDAAESLFTEFFSLFDQQESEVLSFSEVFQELRAALFSGDLFGGPGTTAASSFQLEFSFEFSGSVTVETLEVQQADPIVFDLDGDGIELSSYKQGARFDLLGDGRAVNTAFVNGGDAFLALDRNGDGLINSGKELFGEQHGAANGYEELRKFDSNKDGVIDADDEAFDDLRLFRDNGNGITERGELITLAEAGIESIDLDYIEVDRRAAGGNRLAQLATFRRTNGTLGRTADALLNYTA